MSAVMRSLSVLQEVFVPHVASIITQLTQKLMLVSKVSLIIIVTLILYCWEMYNEYVVQLKLQFLVSNLMFRYKILGSTVTQGQLS